MLKQPSLRALVASNACMSLGSGMQLLLHGWLAVEWGGGLWMLTPLAATRILPKLLGAVPAGMLCDRIARRRILTATRGLAALASLLPLAGFFAPAPLLWVLAASTLGGVIHVVDLPAGRGTLGDVTRAGDLHTAVAFDRAGADLASLLGPLIAFGLASSLVGEPAALVTSAAVLAASALCTRAIPASAHHKTASHGIAPLLGYLRDTPAAVFLMFAGIAPVLVDRGIAMALPSCGGDGALVGLALAAPEAGGLLAAAALTSTRIRLGSTAILAAGLCYALFIAIATQNLQQSEILIAAMAAAGAAKLVLLITAHARLQGIVPPAVRGRVFAL